MEKIIITMIMIGMILPGIAAETMKIYPSDDAYTDNSKASQNFNTESLRVGNDLNFGKQRTYLKFNLSELQGRNISTANLSIDPLFGVVGNFDLDLYYTKNDAWSENSIIWNNAPNVDAFLNSISINPNTTRRIEFDVNLVINETDKTLSLVIKSKQESTSNLYVQLSSSEFSQGETYWPYLEISYTNSTGNCNTQADANEDGKISMTELLTYISQWKLGNVSMSSLLQAIGYWKAGGGC